MHNLHDLATELSINIAPEFCICCPICDLKPSIGLKDFLTPSQHAKCYLILSVFIGEYSKKLLHLMDVFNLCEINNMCNR